MKTVIEMARVSGARDDGNRFEFELRDLEFLVALVRADEREQIAKRAKIAMLGSSRALTLRLMTSIEAKEQQ